jgi:endonuclease/exonuclease/phosphatase family metal-dependent hydrolase
VTVVRRRGVVLGGLMALALLAGTGREASGQAAPAAAPATPASHELRVLTFNIHHAEGVDAKLDVARVAQVIKNSGADLVGLQEVDRGVERSGRRDLLKEIADLAGLRFVFGKNIDHQGGDYGNALLTSRPIVSEGNRLLPNTDGGEQRGVLQVVIDVAGTQVLVLNTHLDARRPDAPRRDCADAMLAMIAAWGPGPVVAMGDFNDVPGSATWTRLTTTLTDVWKAVGTGDGFTIPVEAPRSRIDWVLVRGLDPVSAEVLKTDASDHLPVVATLRLK